MALNPQALLISSKGSWFDAQEKLSAFGIKVIVIDTHDLEKFADNCDLLGKIFNREKQAAQIKAFFGGQFEYVKKQLNNISDKKQSILNAAVPAQPPCREAISIVWLNIQEA